MFPGTPKEVTPPIYFLVSLNVQAFCYNLNSIFVCGIKCFSPFFNSRAWSSVAVRIFFAFFVNCILIGFPCCYYSPVISARSNPIWFRRRCVWVLGCLFVPMNTHTVREGHAEWSGNFWEKKKKKKKKSPLCRHSDNSALIMFNDEFQEQLVLVNPADLVSKGHTP